MQAEEWGLEAQKRTNDNVARDPGTAAGGACPGCVQTGRATGDCADGPGQAGSDPVHQSTSRPAVEPDAPTARRAHGQDGGG